MLRPRAALLVQGSSFPSVEFTAYFVRETTQRELEQVLRSTWQLSWSTSLLRSSSWLATPPVTTRNRESIRAICN